MLNKLFIAALIGLFSSGGFADELTPTKKTDIKSILEMNGIRTLPTQMANDQMARVAPAIRQADKKFPDKGLTIMRDSIAGVLSENIDKQGGLIDQVTNVYHNAFTGDEIKAVLAFYQSPTGKKYLEQQAKLNNDAMQAAFQWAGGYAGEVDRRMKAALEKEKIKLPEPPKPKEAPVKK